MSAPQVLVLGGLAAAFLLLAVWPHPALDERIFVAVNSRHGPKAFEWAVRLVSHFGLLPTNLVIWAAALLRTPLPRDAGIGAAGMVVAWGMCRVLKAATGRLRPFMVVDGARLVGLVPSGSSYPSSHAALAFYTAMVGAHLLGWSGPRQVALYLVAVGVAYSRVYLGAHFPRDVIGGALIGAVVASATIWLLSR